MPQRPDPGLDAHCAGAVLHHLGYDADDVAELGEGTWSRCFAFSDGDRDLVVRIGSTTEDFERDRHAATFRSPALPIPALLDLGWHDDVAFAVSERVRGTPIEHLGADGWRAVLPAVLDVVDAIAAVPRPADGGYGPWNTAGHGTVPSWRAWLLGAADDDREPRLRGWRSRLADHPEVARALDAGLVRLTALAEAGEGRRHVVHGDLINGNVRATDGRITGVLDWGCAVDGDPALSVAELELWAPWHPGLATVDVRSAARRHLEATGGDTTDFDARVDAGAIYLAVAGLSFGVATGATATDQTMLLNCLEHYL